MFAVLFQGKRALGLGSNTSSTAVTDLNHSFWGEIFAAWFSFGPLLIHS